MKNKIIKSVSLIIAMVLLLSGCGNKGNLGAKASGSSTFTIAASFYPMYIFALNIAKDVPNVDVIDVTKPTTGCLHDYAITSSDMKTLSDAQAFIINGAGMESFMDKVTGQLPNLKIIDSSKGIKIIKGPGDTGDNPHLWVSISNAILQVKNIGAQLETIDVKHAKLYKKNTEVYVKKLEAERDKMHKGLDGIKNRDIVTFHEAFPYFAKEFNLNIAGVVEREPGSQPSPKELQESIDMVKKLKVKAIFVEPQYPKTAADTIANETGAKVYTLDPAVTGPLNEDAYINIMDNNLKTLEEALK
jgi:zinc transport system substrate-binding protein